MKEITATKKANRIDKYLPELINATRSQIQKMIKDGKVFINGKECSANSTVEIDDKISYDDNPKKSGKDKNVKIKIAPKIKVIDDTDDYLVINKPSGLIVHGADFIKEYTLVDWLLKHYPKIKKIGDNPIRPGIVHRLDKEVSGLLLVAKNNQSFEFLKQQFQKRTIKKSYTGMVYGNIEREDDEIIFPIKRSEKGYKMAAVPISQKSVKTKTAITYFEVKKHYINYSILNIYPKTGRTHQIRCHLNAIGHPLVGDHLYSTRKTRLLNDKHKLGRIFLVATELKFTAPNNEEKKYKIDIPTDLKKFAANAK